MARPGAAWNLAWHEHGMESGMAWRGWAWLGEAWQGKAWNLAWLGVARRGWARLGKAWNKGGLFPQEQQTNTTQWKQHTQTHS